MMMGQAFMLNYNKKYNGFKSWVDYLNNNPTTPISNYIGFEVGYGFHNEVRKLRLPKETIIKQHQRILGKQKFTWVKFNEKFYIWENYIYKYRIFVAKNNGISIELFDNFSVLSKNTSSIEILKKEMSIIALTHHIMSMGINLSLNELHINNYKYT